LLVVQIRAALKVLGRPYQAKKASLVDELFQALKYGGGAAAGETE
jgi:hypothetical protein